MHCKDDGSGSNALTEMLPLTGDFAKPVMYPFILSKY
jgi:hypothetical protein